MLFISIQAQEKHHKSFLALNEKMFLLLTYSQKLLQLLASQKHWLNRTGMQVLTQCKALNTACFLKFKQKTATQNWLHGLGQGCTEQNEGHLQMLLWWLCSDKFLHFVKITTDALSLHVQNTKSCPSRKLYFCCRSIRKLLFWIHKDSSFGFIKNYSCSKSA